MTNCVPEKHIKLLRDCLFVYVGLQLIRIYERVYAIAAQNLLHIVLQGVKLCLAACVAVSINEADGIGYKVEVQVGCVLVNSKDGLIFSAQKVRQRLSYLLDLLRTYLTVLVEGEDKMPKLHSVCLAKLYSYDIHLFRDVGDM